MLDENRVVGRRRIEFLRSGCKGLQQPRAGMVTEDIGIADSCRDTSRILKTDAPRRAALVRKPLRSECR